jgi:PhzF family phenazine biosynthesis protein
MKLYQVDAFTTQPFAGNPAAVLVLDEFPSDDWMLSFAGEMNLSETAYVHKLDDGFALRWFTPGGEVDLCGHATLATAHVLWTEQFAANDQDTIRFETRSGSLFAHREATDGLIRLDFPATPPTAASPPDGLLVALGATADFVGKSKFDYVVELENAEAVRTLKPDFRVLADVDARGVMVTSRSDDDRYDFVSRFFCPGLNINEDPVTGSAHCCLAPFWSERLGKTEMVGFQASSRGGAVVVRLLGDRVHLLGSARTIFSGELTIPLS